MLPIRQTTCLAQNNPILPQRIFEDGTQGVLYDPTDFSTLFQDSAGTTPVTALEQPVGLMLDKSKGLVLGSELVTNGDFSNGGANWTVTGADASHYVDFSGSNLRYVSGTTSPVLNVSQSCLVPNVWQKITIIVSAFVSGSIKVDGLNGAPILKITSAGTYSAYILQSSPTFNIYSDSANTDLTISLISIKQVTGNHAYQTTSGNRPTLTARYNLLTNTETTGGFGKSDYSNVSLVTGYTGLTDAFFIAETVASGLHYGISSLAYTATTHNINLTVKGVGREYVAIQTNDGSADYVIISLIGNGSLVQKSVNASDPIITNINNGWYNIQFTTLNTSNLNGGLLIYPMLDGSTPTYAGDVAKGIIVWHPDLRVANDGVGLPAYQRVTSSTNYDTAGFPPRLYYNGTNSYLMTNSIDFSATNKMFVCAGLRKLSDAATGVAIELSATSDTNTGVIAVFAPPNANPRYGYRSGGTNTVTPNITGYTAPITNILSGIGQISTDTCKLRVNGTEVVSSTTDQGTGNYGNYPLYIGMRGGSTLPFNGYMGPIVIAGKTMTDRQVTDTETWVNSKTKAY